MKKKIEIEDDWIDDENIYAEDSRNILLDEDEISLEEAAFMQGYEEAG